MNVTIIVRGDELKIIGDDSAVERTSDIINSLVQLAKRGNEITEQNVNYTISLSIDERTGEVAELDKDIICHTINGKPVKAKTLGQKKYLDAIDSNMIVFGIGPAGTGKTYLAMAKAITAFKNNEINRIILTRPAIEAGEKLGFLPGDLQSKVDPYLRPLYDALYEIMGADSFIKNMDKGLIEVAPLAYMRGRTLDNAFIVLDEAQNTTPAQMKMFLTRIGFGSIEYEGLLLTRWLMKLWIILDCPYECEVNILLTDNKGIHELNRTTRDIDAPTDVLSFPAFDFESPADFSVSEDKEADYFNSDSGELMLGDIMISLDKVLEQSKEYGHSITREFAF